MHGLGHFSLVERQLNSWNTDVPTVFLMGLQQQFYHQALLYTKASSESKSQGFDTPWNMMFIFSNVYNFLKQGNETQ